MNIYIVFTYYKGDGPHVGFPMVFQNPVHKGEQVVIWPDSYEDGFNFRVFDVEHGEKQSILFCEHDDLDEEEAKVATKKMAEERLEKEGNK